VTRLVWKFIRAHIWKRFRRKKWQSWEKKGINHSHIYWRDKRKTCFVSLSRCTTVWSQTFCWNRGITVPPARVSLPPSVAHVRLQSLSTVTELWVRFTDQGYGKPLTFHSTAHLSWVCLPTSQTGIKHSFGSENSYGLNSPMPL